VKRKKGGGFVLFLVLFFGGKPVIGNEIHGGGGGGSHLINIAIVQEPMSKGRLTTAIPGGQENQRKRAHKAYLRDWGESLDSRPATIDALPKGDRRATTREKINLKI